jgi:hypothetical protein
MIHTLEKFPGNVVAVHCTGRVTKRDYEVVLIPAVAAAFARHRGIRLYYQTTDDFRMDSGAAWEDLKVGLEYLTRWERIAVVTDVDLLRQAVRASASSCFRVPTPTRHANGSPPVGKPKPTQQPS